VLIPDPATIVMKVSRSSLDDHVHQESCQAHPGVYAKPSEVLWDHSADSGHGDDDTDGNSAGFDSVLFEFMRFINESKTLNFQKWLSPSAIYQLKKSAPSNLNISRNEMVPAFFFSFLLFAKGACVLPPIASLSFSDFLYPDTQGSGRSSMASIRGIYIVTNCFFDVDLARPRAEVAG
jgi:hypothetical protein